MLNSLPNQFQILTKLNEAPDNFILTGSQFFQGSGHDIDFFVQDRPGIDSLLYTAGLRVHGGTPYVDSQCKKVFRGHGIDIQIVKDAALKALVQDRFKRKGILHPTCEQWNLAFDLFSEPEPAEVSF